MKNVLVIGAGDYQIPLIKRLGELGHKVYCLDGNKNAPGFEYADEYEVLNILDKPLCLDYAIKAGISAVMTYGATITLPTVAYIAEHMNLSSLSETTAEISKSKFAIKKALVAGGCNVYGDFFCLHTKEEAKEKKFTIPCVIKPSDGSGSKGVSIVNDESDIESAIDYAFGGARFGEIYVEGFVGGEEYSAEVFCADGKQYVYAVVKTTFYRDASGNLHYGHRAPSGLSDDDENKIKREVLKAADALGVTMGSVNFDVILSDEDKKPYIIDVGIRIGQNLIASHIVPLSRGVNELDLTIELAFGRTVEAEPKYQRCIATRLLIYNAGVLKEIKDYSELIGKDNIIDVVLRKSVGDTLRPYAEKSDSCGWVLASGETPDEAEKNADMAREKLREYIVIE